MMMKVLDIIFVTKNVLVRRAICSGDLKERTVLGDLTTVIQHCRFFQLSIAEITVVNTNHLL